MLWVCVPISSTFTMWIKSWPRHENVDSNKTNMSDDYSLKLFCMLFALRDLMKRYAKRLLCVWEKTKKKIHFGPLRWRWKDWNEFSQLFTFNALMVWNNSTSKAQIFRIVLFCRVFSLRKSELENFVIFQFKTFHISSYSFWQKYKKHMNTYAEEKMKTSTTTNLFGENCTKCARGEENGSKREKWQQKNVKFNLLQWILMHQFHHSTNAFACFLFNCYIVSSMCHWKVAAKLLRCALRYKRIHPTCCWFFCGKLYFLFPQ